MAEVNSETISIIMGLSANHSNRKIAEILSNQGIKLSHVTVGKIVKDNRKERAEQTKEVVNEYIKKTVTSDLEILEDMRDQLNQYRKDPNLRISEKLMCMDRLNKVIDTRLKYSGAEEKENNDIKIKVSITDADD